MSDERYNSDGFSFESILAEVKGSAFINNEKKTPPDVLEEKADRILREAEVIVHRELEANSHEYVANPNEQAGGTSANSYSRNSSLFDDTFSGSSNAKLSSEIESTSSIPILREMSPKTSMTDDYSVNNRKTQNEVDYGNTYHDFQTKKYTNTHLDDSGFDSSSISFDNSAELELSKRMNEVKQKTREKTYRDTVKQYKGEPDFSQTDDIPKLRIVSDSTGNSQKRTGVSENTGSFSNLFEERESKKKKKSKNLDTLDSPFVENSAYEIQSTKKTSGSAFFDQLDDSGNAGTKFITKTHNPENFDDDLQEKRVPIWKSFFNRTPKLDSKSKRLVNEEEQFFEEPNLREAAHRFAMQCNSISLRCIPAFLITLLMISITYVFESGMLVPFAMGRSVEHTTAALLIGLLAVMMLCVDVIIRGYEFLIKGTPNVETLILFSCGFSVISSMFSLISNMAPILPFSAVSAITVVCAAYGEKINLRALTDTLKTAMSSSEPYGVLAEHNPSIDKSVLKKANGRIDGFYSNLISPDVTEMTYKLVSPILLIAAPVLTLLIILMRGGVEFSLHIISAFFAAAAPFSALLSFSIPFVTVAKSVKRSGAALAGWGGADDICFTDGVCVTDDDLFPPGTLRLSSVKVYDNTPTEMALRYTASLILSSGSGLTSLFVDVLKQHGMSPDRVDDFQYHESGIAAYIKGMKIATGSAAFMNLNGIRVPDDTNMKNAVYTALNGKLVAMFAIDYKPLPSVQSALISMLKWRIELFFAMRDFNVTPSMVGQKFKVPFESFVFIPAKDSYSISDPYSDKNGRISAILIREGLGPFADAITAGRLLRAASLFSTLLSVASAFLGVLIMFLLNWNFAFLSASPGNLIIFMLCMLATVLVVCGYVRLKK